MSFFDSPTQRQASAPVRRHCTVRSADAGASQVPHPPPSPPPPGWRYQYSPGGPETGCAPTTPPQPPSHDLCVNLLIDFVTLCCRDAQIPRRTSIVDVPNRRNPLCDAVTPLHIPANTLYHSVTPSHRHFVTFSTFSILIFLRAVYQFGDTSILCFQTTHSTPQYSSFLELRTSSKLKQA